MIKKKLDRIDILYNYLFLQQNMTKKQFYNLKNLRGLDKIQHQQHHNKT